MTEVVQWILHNHTNKTMSNLRYLPNELRQKWFCGCDIPHEQDKAYCTRVVSKMVANTHMLSCN